MIDYLCYNFSMFTLISFAYLKKLLLTFMLAMVPVVELRGALPFGVGMGLSPLTALIVSILGNMVPVPFILLLFRKLLNWMYRIDRFNRLASKLEAKASKAGDALVKYETLGLFLLVAIPLPGTGAWTGAMAAAIFDLRIKNAIPAIFAGIIVAGIIVFTITYGIVLIF